MKRKFLVTHDYQHGAVAFYIYAESKDQVLEYFPEKYNDIYESDFKRSPVLKAYGDIEIPVLDIEEIAESRAEWHRSEKE